MNYTAEILHYESLWTRNNWHLLKRILSLPNPLFLKVKIGINILRLKLYRQWISNLGVGKESVSWKKNLGVGNLEIAFYEMRTVT